MVLFQYTWYEAKQKNACVFANIVEKNRVGR